MVIEEVDSTFPELSRFIQPLLVAYLVVFGVHVRSPLAELLDSNELTVGRCYVKRRIPTIVSDLDIGLGVIQEKPGRDVQEHSVGSSLRARSVGRFRNRLIVA